MKTLELPYDEEVRLAVTGWSGTRRCLRARRKPMEKTEKEKETEEGGKKIKQEKEKMKI